MLRRDLNAKLACQIVCRMGKLIVIVFVFGIGIGIGIGIEKGRRYKAEPKQTDSDKKSRQSV